MLTNPSTLGLFEKQVKEIAKMVHDVGALFYLDGANMNALVGLVRPGDMGFDIMHLNLHKTFSTPHGGGGPAAGPVGVSQALTPFLPVPRVRKTEQGYSLEEASPLSIGKMRAFNGNSLILLRAYIYIRCLGREGVRKNTEIAILNANYLRVKLRTPIRWRSTSPACTNASSPRPSRNRRASERSISPNACSTTAIIPPRSTSR